MRAKYWPAQITVTGLLRTEYRFGPPGFGENPWEDSVEAPFILSLREPVDIEPNEYAEGEAEGRYLQAHSNVLEVHVAMSPRDNTPWEEVQERLESLTGWEIEITGELEPAHTGHHHRPILLFCDPSNIRPLRRVDIQSEGTARAFIHGSGTLLDAKGHVLTALHVVRGTVYTVRRGPQRVEARLVARNEELDAAILKTDMTPSHALSIRSFLPPQLGERVYACGFPLRPYFAHSLNITDGIVSGYGPPKAWYFTITAPIQRGNSGGPVFDSFGNLLGFVTGVPSSRRLAASLGESYAKSEKTIIQMVQDRSGARTLEAANPPWGPFDVQSLNQAVAVSLLSGMLRDVGAAVEDSPFMHATPPEVTGLDGVRIARIARQLCVEVEGWRIE